MNPIRVTSVTTAAAYCDDGRYNARTFGQMMILFRLPRTVVFVKKKKKMIALVCFKIRKNTQWECAQLKKIRCQPIKGKTMPGATDRTKDRCSV